MTRMASLAIELVSKASSSIKDFTLSAIYTNTTNQPLALAFWWNRSMRIIDGNGQIVVPGPGTVLPCGVSERWQIVMPGHKVQRAEPLSCTQPAGRPPNIGWAYKLAPGRYRITLVFEAPAAHGFSQSEPNDHAFRGRVESREVAVELF